jgi:hypothetical protein
LCSNGSFQCSLTDLFQSCHRWPLLGSSSVKYHLRDSGDVTQQYESCRKRCRHASGASFANLYQRTGEDTKEWEDLVHAVVNCRVCELAIAI